MYLKEIFLQLQVKNFKIYDICKSVFITLDKRDKNLNRYMVQTQDPQIASMSLNWPSYGESYQTLHKQDKNCKSN